MLLKPVMGLLTHSLDVTRALSLSLAAGKLCAGTDILTTFSLEIQGGLASHAGL